jgi:hypothetical protein
MEEVCIYIDWNWLKPRLNLKKLEVWKLIVDKIEYIKDQYHIIKDVEYWGSKLIWPGI